MGKKRKSPAIKSDSKKPKPEPEPEPEKKGTAPKHEITHPKRTAEQKKAEHPGFF